MMLLMPTLTMSCHACSVSFVAPSPRSRFCPACNPVVDRRCSACGEVLPPSSFYLRNGIPMGHCKPCAAESSAESKARRLASDPDRVRAQEAATSARWRERNPEAGAEWARANPEKVAARMKRYRERHPERVAERQFRHKLRLRFRLTPEQYAEMLAAQGGGCALCGESSIRRRLDLDHDHACCPDRDSCCGKCVRGLLCTNCNNGLGRFKDDPDLLRRAADYVSKVA